VVLAALTTGCLDAQRCDPGDRLVDDFVCRHPDAAVADGGVGAACGGDATCGPEAPVCTGPLADGAGYCTLADCAGASSCPSGFACVDLSADPARPSTLCLRVAR
jgi:hypothetical protein